MNETGRKILKWYGKNKRKLPWRETKDPYKIWISEIMLQQTRVDQGLDYYIRFVDRFPDVKSLADASEDEVLKYWQGLGYYSRARNLHFSAKYIANELNANFPNSYDEILKLKGVGPYTAAAISSIAFNLPHPVMDGNVHRIISRIFSIKEPINSTAGLKKISEKVDSIFIEEEAGDFNQAMMEFGALFCTPKQPQCAECFLKNSCLALKEGVVKELPLKIKNKSPKDFYIYYFVFYNKKNKTVYLRKRSSDGIWKNLYDFPSIDSDKEISVSDLLQTGYLKNLCDIKPVIDKPYLLKHKLSHKNIFAHFFLIPIVDNLSLKPNENIDIVPLDQLHNYPVSRLIDLYLSGEFSSQLT